MYNYIGRYSIHNHTQKIPTSQSDEQKYAINFYRKIQELNSFKFSEFSTAEKLNYEILLLKILYVYYV